MSMTMFTRSQNPATSYGIRYANIYILGTKTNILGTLISKIYKFDIKSYGFIRIFA